MSAQTATVTELPAPSDISNVEAEAILLGTMMVNPARIDRVADIVRAEDFKAAVHGRIFDAIVHQASLGRGVSPVAIKGLFEGDEDLASVGGPSYLARLTASPEIYLLDERDLARQIVDLAERRRMRAGLLEAIGKCADLSTPLPEIAAAADAAVSARAETGLIESDAADCVRDTLTALDKGTTGVLCERIPDADALLGPLEPKSLTILAARPGMGKTCFCSSYALGAARAGHGVLFVSLEMSKEQLMGRMLADVAFDDDQARVPYTAIQKRDLNNWQRNRVAEVGGWIARLPLTIVDAGSLTVGRLDMLVRRHKRRMAARGVSLDLVVVDYLQLLHPDMRGRSAYEAISEISKRLKGIAKDHDIAMFALAQLSRGVESRQDKRPMLSDLRDSGQIEQDADAVMFLMREEYYLQQTEPKDDPDEHEKWERQIERCRGVIDFILAKRRNGSPGSARGRFFAPYQAVR